MARKKRSPEENERRAKIRERLQLANVSSMDGFCFRYGSCRPLYLWI